MKSLAGASIQILSLYLQMPGIRCWTSSGTPATSPRRLEPAERNRAISESNSPTSTDSPISNTISWLPSTNFLAEIRRFSQSVFKHQIHPPRGTTSESSRFARGEPTKQHINRRRRPPFHLEETCPINQSAEYSRFLFNR
jgi:hypothetical protein